MADQSFTQFLTSNKNEKTLNLRLSKELKIGEHVPATYNKSAHDEEEAFRSNKRPDLTFVISNQTLDAL